MKFSKLFLVCAILAACGETTNVYPTKVVEVQKDVPKIEYVNTLDCKSVGGFKQGDKCVSNCSLCGPQEACVDTDSDLFFDTCKEITTENSLPSDPTMCVSVMFYLDNDCDGVDNDCDGQTDEDPLPNPAKVSTSQIVSFWPDLDADGYGDAWHAFTFCVGHGPVGWIKVGGDCNDSDASIHPGAEEKCDNVDQNCDGNKDFDFMPIWHFDNDGDGYGDAFAKVTEACLQPTGMVLDGQDCDDDNAKVHPNGDEICGDLIDQNCNKQVDEKPCVTYVPKVDPNSDIDGDGYTGLEDCNDLDANIHPGLDNCPTIDQLTKYSYKLVFVWGGKADPNWFYKNTLKYKQMTNPGLGGTGYVTTEAWDSWSGVEFVKDTFVAIDLDPTVEFIRFNMMQYPGTWEICNTNITEDFTDFTTLNQKLNLPTIYVVKNGTWENVTSEVKMLLAMDVVPGGKIPKSTSPSGYPVPNYCSAYLTF